MGWQGRRGDHCFSLSDGEVRELPLATTGESTTVTPSSHEPLSEEAVADVDVSCLHGALVKLDGEVRMIVTVQAVGSALTGMASAAGATSRHATGGVSAPPAAETEDVCCTYLYEPPVPEPAVPEPPPPERRVQTVVL